MTGLSGTVQDKENVVGFIYLDLDKDFYTMVHEIIYQTGDNGDQCYNSEVTKEETRGGYVER